MQRYAAVLANLEIHLPVPGIHGDDSGRSMLEEAIGKSSRRSPDVETNLAPNIDVPMLQRALKLQSSSADVFQILYEQPDSALSLDLYSCFFHFLLLDEHLARENERLRPLT
jgi:hypothetical protein